MRDESTVQQLIQLCSPKVDCWLLRNNSGAMVDGTGRVVRFGLGNESKKLNATFKSSDLIGIKTITITPEMVGKKVGVFTACEVKEEGWKFRGKPRESAQKNFIDWVRARGGFAMFAQSAEDFLNNLKL